MNKYQGDVVRIEKLDPNLVYTVLYWDNAAKAFYVKRFSFTESNNSPVLFISDARGSKLVDITSDLHPQIVLTFGGKYEHRETEIVDAEEFIAKKGLTAKGKKCSAYDLKSVEFGEPLHKPEDDMAEEAPAEAVANTDEAIDVEEDFTADVPDLPESGAPIEQTGQAADLLKGTPDDPIDVDNWEPTLF